MIKDRGTMKWTAMMLPEHVQMLKDIWEEDYKVVKPSLDEQELEKLDSLVAHALKLQSEVTISYYNNGTFHEIIGIIYSVNRNTKECKIKDKSGDIVKCNLNAVFNVTLN